MTSGRDLFLQRVRQAAAAGNRPGAAADIPPRGKLGYQGAGSDPVARFCTELTAAGGCAYPVADGNEALVKLLDLLRGRPVRRVLLGRGRFLDALPLAERLREQGLEVIQVEELGAANCRAELFAGDVGISEADHLIAETGTLAITARPDEPRSLSLLPPVHLVLANHTQILPDLFDLFEAYASGTGQKPSLPSCLALVTGPSKTGDIELRLVTGVHGPGEMHVVLMR
jgi:L-lactate utilization protein LutC